MIHTSFYINPTECNEDMPTFSMSFNIQLEKEPHAKRLLLGEIQNEASDLVDDNEDIVGIEAKLMSLWGRSPSI